MKNSLIYKFIFATIIIIFLFKDSGLNYQKENFDVFYLANFIFLLLFFMMKVFNWKNNIRIIIIIFLSFSALVAPLKVFYSMFFLNTKVWGETVKVVGLSGALLPLGVTIFVSFLCILCVLIMGKSDIVEFLKKRRNCV